MTHATYELMKAFPNVWCPDCGKVQPMKIAIMKANDRNNHDAADILCSECRLVVTTLHAEPATQFA
jgi:phage terminase large subunit GpA-like protein